jgi:hypothetical protein
MGYPAFRGTRVATGIERSRKTEQPVLAAPSRWPLTPFVGGSSRMLLRLSGQGLVARVKIAAGA